jgi:hypothetical protein
MQMKMTILLRERKKRMRLKMLKLSKSHQNLLKNPNRKILKLLKRLTARPKNQNKIKKKKKVQNM